MLFRSVALGTRLVSALREAAAFSSGQAKHKRPVQDSVIVRRMRQPISRTDAVRRMHPAKGDSESGRSAEVTNDYREPAKGDSRTKKFGTRRHREKNGRVPVLYQSC